MTASTHSHHVSEQHLLGPNVEHARDDRGAQVLAAAAVDGEGEGEGGQSVVDALADIAPALAHLVAYAFGDVCGRRQRHRLPATTKPSLCQVRARDPGGDHRDDQEGRLLTKDRDDGPFSDET